MTQQDLNQRSGVDHAALAMLVRRIKARQERQMEMWRGPIPTAASAAALPATEDGDQ